MKAQRVKFDIGDMTVYFSHSALRRWNLTRGSNEPLKSLRVALRDAHFGPKPPYIRNNDRWKGLSLIVDSRGCFLVKPKGRRYGTAIGFFEAPRDKTLRRGFVPID